EPWGRYLTGGLELVAVLLLLVPRTIWMGATLAGGLMLGAIISHLAVLGVVVIGPDGRGDGGLLFSLAAIDGLFAAAVLWIRRDSIPFLARE
ncbi:MAG TPA: DoxX family protein, partial [Leptospiraceae bacterium]|nr:DoxX family protein [Leptospiraceae bacterium]